MAAPLFEGMKLVKVRKDHSNGRLLVLVRLASAVGIYAGVRCLFVISRRCALAQDCSRIAPRRQGGLRVAADNIRSRPSTLTRAFRCEGSEIGRGMKRNIFAYLQSPYPSRLGAPTFAMRGAFSPFVFCGSWFGRLFSKTRVPAYNFLSQLWVMIKQ